MKQKFADFDAFKEAVEAEDGLKISQDDWLPHSLIADTMRVYGQGKFELKPGANKQPEISVKTKDGSRLVGSFVLNGQKVQSVSVSIDDLGKVMKDAQELLDAGKKAEAKAALIAGIKQNPKSPLIADARKLMKATQS